MKNVFLEISQNLQENKHMYRGLFFDKVANLDLFSCEFCDIFKNNVFTDHLRKTASIKATCSKYRIS